MLDLEMPSADGGPLWETYLSANWFPALLAADQLGIPASLARAPAGVAELAGREGLNRRALGAVLPLLASLGYLAPRAGRYHLTDTGLCYLLPESEHYWGGVFATHRRSNPACRRLEQVLTTPDPTSAVPRPEGTDLPGDAWASGELGPERAAEIVRYMHSHSVTAAVGVAQHADFSRARRLLDVGGCSGCFSVALARRNPDLACTVMDLPSVCEVAREYVAAAGLAGRVDTAAVDMFREPWPNGNDAVLFSNVLHDWRPETCAELLRRAYDALVPGGTVNVHEMLLDDDGGGPRIAASFAVLMVIGTQGQQFRFTELEELLGDAGFVGIECRSTSPHFSLVRGRKPDGG